MVQVPLKGSLKHLGFHGDSLVWVWFWSVVVRVVVPERLAAKVVAGFVDELLVASVVEPTESAMSTIRRMDSSKLAEGVDLHLDGRHVIHHDLDRNPSTLEQRTGRVDRIESKAEVTGKQVVVYEPYVGGTHDEKMFRVVKDRERWFGIVMGGGCGSEVLETAHDELRVPLSPTSAP